MRLRALRDPPMAFGSTFARERGYEPEQWRRWAAESATGAGRALVDAVVAWATDRGAQRLMTSVTEGNAAAAALCAAAGFADTGRREPLGHSAGVVAVLERPLGPS